MEMKQNELDKLLDELYDNKDAVDMSGRDLSGAVLQDRNLDCSDFQDANMTHVQAQGSSWVYADLRGVKAQRSDFRNANFSEADIAGADFRFCDLRGVDFTNTNKAGALFFGCQSDDREIQKRENFLSIARRDVLLRRLIKERVKGLSEEKAIDSLFDVAITPDELIYFFGYNEETVKAVARERYTC